MAAVLKYKFGWCLAGLHFLFGLGLFYLFFVAAKHEVIFFLALIDLPITWFVDSLSGTMWRFLSLPREWKQYCDFILFIVLGSVFYYVVGAIIQKISHLVWRRLNPEKTGHSRNVEN